MTGWLADAVFYEIYPQSFADSERRRRRRPPGVARPPGPPGLARRGRGLVQPLLRLAVPGRGLRRLATTSASRRGTAPTTTWSRSSRPPASRGIRVAARPGRRAHLDRARVVPASAADDRDRRPLHLVATGPADPASCASPGPRPGLLPEELLRRAARAELRLRPARTRPSRGASRSTRRARAPTGRRCGRSSPSGWTAAWPASASTWRTRWSRTTRARRDGRAVAGDARLAARRRTRTRCCCRRATATPGRHRRARRASTPTSSSSSTPRTARCSTTAAPARCPWLPDHERCYFDADGPTGGADAGTLPRRLWDEHRRAAGADRLVVLAIGRPRLLPAGLRRPDRGAARRGVRVPAHLGHRCPSIYYGDEIGMRYLPGLPDHEGSVCDPGYNRAGCRTPDAVGRRPAQRRLLRPPRPTGSTCRRTRRRTGPTVAAQRDDPDSPLQPGPAADPAAPARRRRCARRPRRQSSPAATRSTYLRGDDHLVVDYFMAGLDQVCRHRSPHDAQS